MKKRIAAVESSSSMNTHRHHGRNLHNSRSQKLTTTAIHIMAIDGIVNVNSLFTIGVFLGLAFNPTDPHFTFVDTPTCISAASTAENFIAFHVYSFSSFLFSSLVASGLKLAIRTIDPGEPHSPDDASAPHTSSFLHGVAHVNLKILRAGILTSAFGSAAGCLFLMMALLNFVQIKLGSIQCWNLYNFAAFAPLVILVPTALVIYIFVVLHAFTR